MSRRQQKMKVFEEEKRLQSGRCGTVGFVRTWIFSVQNRPFIVSFRSLLYLRLSGHLIVHFFLFLFLYFIFFIIIEEKGWGYRTRAGRCHNTSNFVMLYFHFFLFVFLLLTSFSFLSLFNETLQHKKKVFFHTFFFLVLAFYTSHYSHALFLSFSPFYSFVFLLSISLLLFHLLPFILRLRLPYLRKGKRNDSATITFLQYV